MVVAEEEEENESVRERSSSRKETMCVTEMGPKFYARTTDAPLQAHWC
jgi:hypothetical protein